LIKTIIKEIFLIKGGTFIPAIAKLWQKFQYLKSLQFVGDLLGDNLKKFPMSSIIIIPLLLQKFI
jgi:hypothetical protein